MAMAFLPLVAASGAAGARGSSLDAALEVGRRGSAHAPPQATAIIAHAEIARAAHSVQTAVAGPDLATSEAKAIAAAKQAEAAVKVIAAVSAENNAVVPLVQGEAAEAQVALKTAQDAVAEAQRIVAETKTATEQAAMQAAKDYLLETKKAGAKVIKDSVAAHAAAESKAEVAAAKAAASAAEPWHTAIIRGAKVEHEYITRAQELAAASNAVKEQALTLQGAAANYQFQNQPMLALQMQMQADSLMRDGQRYADEAKRLYAIATKVNGLIPQYNVAADVAAGQAMDAASGANVPAVDVPYLLEVGHVQTTLRGRRTARA